MTKIKSLLLGTAAGFVAVAGAQAADMPVKAAPVNYVKICSLYGDGFYYIPGTDTCLKMGGYLRVQAEYNMGGGGVVVGDSAGGELSQGRFTRDLTNDINYRVRGAISWDVRQQTEYGTLRTYIRFGAENTTPTATGGGTTFNPFWDRAFIQFAGFTVGRSQSFFDLFTYGGAYSYHNVRVSGDTGASGQNLWAYTAQFGNGFSGTLSAEDPATRKGGTVDLAAGGFPLLPAAALVADNAFAINGVAQQPAPSASGCRTSSPTCALIRPGASSASALPCMMPAAPTTVPTPLPTSPPSEGWATAIPQTSTAGRWLAAPSSTLAGGDMIGFNVCYAEGAPGFCTNNNVWTLYNSSTSVGVGWIADGVFNTGTDIELTKVWSALAGYEHIWNPKWRTSVFGGYVNVQYSSAATNGILQHTPGALAACGVAPVGAINSADHATAGQQLQPRPELLGSRHPHPVEPSPTARCRPRSALLPAQYRLQRRRRSCPPTARVPPRPRPRRPERLVRNVPLAAQLLSMIA